MRAGVIGLLALRNLAYRPWRSIFLLAGYGVGVAVMIVLLSIGEALLTQARDERLVGGGEITVLPEGIDVEVMKTGGLGGLFFSIANAGFIHRQLLASPRLGDVVRAVSPQIEDKLLYLRAGGRELTIRAVGEIPSATRAVGAAPEIASGTWDDDTGDRRWLTPTPAELRHDIDHFHLPPAGLAHAESWGEWHYFNILSPDAKQWVFLSLIIGGDVRGEMWGGQVLVTTHQEGGRSRRFAATFPRDSVRFSTADANLRIGGSTVTVMPDGRYAVHAVAREDGGDETLTADLVVSPAPGAYFPGASLGSGDFVSGYAVAALRADASGSICVARRCERYDAAQAYHDHNWGVWSGVTWEWGAARAGDFTILYGRVNPPDRLDVDSPLFLFLVDSLGFRSLFRPATVTYAEGRTTIVDGRTVRVPARAVLADARGVDTLRVDLEIEDATATDMRRSAIERGEPGQALMRTPYFVQMKGIARISGRVGGKVVQGEGRGFFETYR
jgi:hypothetical protein